MANVLEHVGGNQHPVICRVLGIGPDLAEGEIAALRRRVEAASPKSEEVARCQRAACCRPSRDIT